MFTFSTIGTELFQFSINYVSMNIMLIKHTDTFKKNTFISVTTKLFSITNQSNLTETDYVLKHVY